MKSAHGKIWIWVMWLAALLWLLLMFPFAARIRDGQRSWGMVVLLALLPVIFGGYLLASGIWNARARWGRLLGGLLLLSFTAYLIGVIVQEDARFEASRKCRSNMTQLGLALLQYAGDHEDHMPEAAKWVDEIYPYIKNWDLFHCPADRSKSRSSYAMNANLSRKKLEEIRDPEHTVLLYETSRPSDNPFGVGKDLLLNSRHRFNNFLFADGHIRFRGGHF